MVTLFSKISVEGLEARNNHIRNSKTHKHQKDKSGNGNTHFPSPAPAPLPHRGSNPNPSSSFDLFSFGAKGDGVSDDSKVINKKFFISAYVNLEIYCHSLTLHE